jgi:hypothetical protein
MKRVNVRDCLFLIHEEDIKVIVDKKIGRPNDQKEKKYNSKDV